MWTTSEVPVATITVVQPPSQDTLIFCCIKSHVFVMGTFSSSLSCSHPLLHFDFWPYNSNCATYRHAELLMVGKILPRVTSSKMRHCVWFHQTRMLVLYKTVKMFDDMSTHLDTVHLHVMWDRDRQNYRSIYRACRQCVARQSTFL